MTIPVKQTSAVGGNGCTCFAESWRL